MTTLMQILLISICLLTTTVTLAEPLTAEKKQRIDILLDKTGADRIAQLVANQFIRLSSASLQRTNPNIDAAAYQIISEEVNKVITEEVKDKNAVKKMIYPIYHQHLSLADINEFIKFYNTPLGKKMLSLMPQINSESMEAARLWGQSLAPVIRQRLEARFEKEDIQYR